MTVERQVIGILDSVLSLKGRAQGFTRATPLLGALPELDSMGVLGIITALEERYGITIHDDEIDGATFHTLGALVDFVEGKLGAN